MALALLIRCSSAGEVPDGADSLFFTVKFPDEAAKTEALRHDVSINIKNQVSDGRGQEYALAVTHIASTDYPVVPGLGPWTKVEADPLGLTYQKEVLPIGEYYKESENLSFAITPESLKKLMGTYTEFQNNGIRVPFQMLHDGDGKGLGEVVGLSVQPRSRQLPPPSATALSRRVPALALSQFPVKASSAMTLDQLAQMLGVTFPDGADDAAKLAAIKAKLTEINTAVDQAMTQAGAGAGKTDPSQAAAASQQAGQVAGQQVAAGAGAGMATTNPGAVATPGLQQGAAVQLPTNTPSKITLQFSQSPTTINSIVESRKNLIDAFVVSGAITPAEADTAKLRYLVPQTIQFSLAAKEQGMAFDPYSDWVDGVKAKIAAGQNGWSPNGRSDANVNGGNGQPFQVALSNHGGQGNISPMRASRIAMNKRMGLDENGRRAS